MKITMEIGRKEDKALWYLWVTASALLVVLLALSVYWGIRATFFPVLGWD